MEILQYKESDQILSVVFSGKAIWDYRPITPSMYNEIKSSNDSKKALAGILRNSFTIIGTMKRTNRDNRS